MNFTDLKKDMTFFKYLSVEKKIVKNMKKYPLGDCRIYNSRIRLKKSIISEKS